jgi:hypothetical protein
MGQSGRPVLGGSAFSRAIFTLPTHRPGSLSPAAVKRRTLLLLLALGVSVIFAAWQWFRPYDWSPDKAARYQVVHASLTRDHSYLWLNVFLERKGDSDHDLTKPVLLLTADGRELEPAETTLGGDEKRGTESLGFRFWLQDGDFTGPVKLRLNEGELIIRKQSGVPGVNNGTPRYFTTSNW